MSSDYECVSAKVYLIMISNTRTLFYTFIKAVPSIVCRRCDLCISYISLNTEPRVSCCNGHLWPVIRNCTTVPHAIPITTTLAHSSQHPSLPLLPTWNIKLGVLLHRIMLQNGNCNAHLYKHSTGFVIIHISLIYIPLLYVIFPLQFLYSFSTNLEIKKMSKIPTFSFIVFFLRGTYVVNFVKTTNIFVAR